MPLDPKLEHHVTVSSYAQQRDLLLRHLKKLPPTEMHYFFGLLIASMENESNPEHHTHLLVKATQVVIQLNHYYEKMQRHKNPDLTDVTTALDDLIVSSEIRSPTHRLKLAVLSICSVVTGFIFGVSGATIGFIGGLLSDYTIIGNLRNAGLSFLTGLLLGIYAGSRCPNKVFQSAFERKLEFCINSLSKVGRELSTKKSHEAYEAETKQYILDVFFKDIPDSEKEAAFQAFLASDNERFQVSTKTAGFITPTLKGHLGHHTLIAYSINGKQHIPMEYGDREKTPRFFDQNEAPRVVTGKKLFDMLVLDRILQETYEYTMDSVLHDYDTGTNDCKTYIDKILLGTHQAPTQIDRFNPQYDKWTGTHIVGPTVRFFSTSTEKELVPLVKYYKKNPNDPDPVITAKQWVETNEKTPEDQSHDEPSEGTSLKMG